MEKKFYQYLIMAIGLAAILYVVLNQAGCVGKIIKEKEIVHDTVQHFVPIPVEVEIPVPEIVSKPVLIEKPIYITNDEEYEAVIDSIQQVYFSQANYLRAIIVDLENMIFELEDADSLPVLTSVKDAVYIDSVKTEEYMHRYKITTLGILKGYEYSYEPFIPKSEPRKETPNQLQPYTRFSWEGDRGIGLIYNHKFLGLGAEYGTQRKDVSILFSLKFEW